MNNLEKIETNKEKIIPALFEWAETFDWELDEDGEKSDEAYNEVYSLAERLENGNCDRDDYENIYFHIWQINYSELKINL
jgi:hypothetical protein